MLVKFKTRKPNCDFESMHHDEVIANNYRNLSF